MGEYSFYRIDESRYIDLITISKSAFGIDPGLSYYEMKGRTRQFGEPFLGYIAYHSSGEPAAFYGVYAHPVIHEGKQYSAAQSGDTMTHKNHTGKGLFITLAKMTYDLAAKNGLSFVFGFPNDNSYPGFAKKLNWVFPEKLKEYRQKVGTLPFAKLAKKVLFIRSLYNIYSKIIFSFYRPDKLSFQNSANENNNLTVLHSDDFVKYKSFSGCRLVKIGSVHAWIRVDGFLFIGDIEKNLTVDIAVINKKIRQLAFFLGADVIIFQTSPDTYFDKAFGSILKSKDAYQVGYINFNSELPLEKIKFVMADFDTF